MTAHVDWKEIYITNHIYNLLIGQLCVEAKETVNTFADANDYFEPQISGRRVKQVAREGEINVFPSE